MDIKALREEFGKLNAETRNVIEAAAKDNRGLKAEEKEGNDKRFARMDEIKNLIDSESRLAGLQFAKDGAQHSEPLGKAEVEEAAEGGEKKFDADAYRKALNQYAKTGIASRELFVMQTSDQSGIHLPKEVLRPVHIKRLPNGIRAALAAYGLSPITRTRVGTVNVPVWDDSANDGTTATQTSTTDTAADPSLTGSLTLDGSTLYQSKTLWLSNTQVATFEFDVTSEVVPVLHKRMDKVQEEAAVNEMIANATVGKTLSNAASVLYRELIEWEHSLEAPYREDAAFIVSDGLYAELRGMVDDNNRPIIDVNPTDPFEGRIHGKPVIISTKFSNMSNNAMVGAFCSAEALKQLDIVPDRLEVYRAYPGKPDQIGFNLFRNGDFGFVSKGVRLLKCGTGT